MEPIENIEWIPAALLQANGWNPNRVFKQEMRLLEHSLLSTGWVQPVLVNENYQIIDGFHRWRLSQDSPRMRNRWGGMVPVCVLAVGDAEAMAMTVRMNRAKGTHVAVNMAELVKCLHRDHGRSREWISDEIGAPLIEVDILLADDLFALRNIKDWSYSEAWYPKLVDQPGDS